jgi:hypothetical protein
MEVCHTADILGSPAAQRLRHFVHKHEDAWQNGTPDFEQFERELHEHVMALERELVTSELARYDVAADQIEVAGVVYHPVLSAAETYLSAAGPVRVERHLYRPMGRNAKSLCPLELRAGLVAGYWTPRAARQGAFVMAHLTSGEAEALFDELGGLRPSRSSLDRLPRDLSAPWEVHRPEWEAALREQETVASEAAVVALSVDGVMVAMKSQAQQRTAQRSEPGKHASGPAGQREVGCGTLSLYDREGERRYTVRYARMPESKKVTLQQQIQAETQAICTLRPDLRRVHLADGAEGNWQLLAEVETALGLSAETWIEIVDFYHACDHLKNGCDAIWGESTPRSQAEFLRLKTLLKEEGGGADRILRTFKHHASRSRGHRHRRIQTELTYFRKQRPRMDYADYQRQHLPIGSGVVEAACKTLVTQRLKGSGMAWSPAGGQAILTLRSLIQSDRWSRAWTLLSAAFRQSVHEFSPSHPPHPRVESIPPAERLSAPQPIARYAALPLAL